MAKRCFSWALSVLLHVVALSQQVAGTNSLHVIRDKRQAEFSDTLSTYEVVVPVKVNQDGRFVSHDLHHDYVRQSSNRIRRSTEAESVHYQLRVDGGDLHVELLPSKRFMAPHLVVERGKQRIKLASDRQCHYQGHIRNHSNSIVALSTCQGLRGVMRTENGEYFIEPVKGHDLKIEPRHPHIIYKRSSLPLESKRDGPPVSNSTLGSCGTKDEFQSDLRERELWEKKQRPQKNGKTSRRKKRSVSSERNVETFVVADKMMMDYYSNEDIETYILTVMNMVSVLYRDASIGNAINVVLVRIMLLENEEHELQEELSISHHADNTLKSFCKWQSMVNPKDESHPHHHDVAILLTRYNICTRMNEPCSTLGLAEVAGMCQPHRSCNVNEDTGLALAYTIAHEMGHNFGMNHDGPHNGCQAPYGERQHVMSPHLNSDTSPLVWSSCSRQEITKFLDRDWGQCLDDEPSEHDFSFPELPPGAMYDADHQCRLQYGPDAAYCPGIEDICLTLWCRLESKCVTRMEPAAPGTQCGKHKWCFMGECTLIGERSEAIDGDWGQWSDWTECSRTCGAGVTASERHCNNPPPANGGKYCIGERKRYKVCNIKHCPEGSPSFRSVQCSSYNDKPYKDELHTWLPISTLVTPCQLHCKPEGKFYSLMLSDTVIDGTPCKPGTRDMCINGKCRKVSCDWGIESGAQEDRCGICHGDGTQCQTIRGEFLLEEGQGYAEAVVVPSEARNIRVEEIEESNNYLAVQAENGSYCLNGNWFIHWSGEYRAAGSTIYYQREGEKETLHIPGPILESLKIMILYQTTNPGIRYEYTVPIANVTRKPEFHWEYTDWTVCTTTCGGGIQKSSAHCIEKEAGLVEDKYCNITQKPGDITRICNKHQCPARWWMGPWQHCSVTCGNNGFRRRTVICVRSFGKDEQMALNDKDCDEQLKPSEMEPCQHKQPCPGDIFWVTGNWTDTCRGDPCNNQTRTIRCSIEGGPCERHLKPPAFRQCGNITCGRWTIGNWSECSLSCGIGVQFRRVSCENGLKCLDSTEPESVRLCNHSCSVPPSGDDTGSQMLIATDKRNEYEHDQRNGTFYHLESGGNNNNYMDNEGSGTVDSLIEEGGDSLPRKHRHHHRWHYSVDGERKKHHSGHRSHEDRPQGFVEDKIDHENFQVISIESNFSNKEKYGLLSDQWFQEGLDTMDYQKRLDFPLEEESNSQSEFDHVDKTESIGEDMKPMDILEIKPVFQWKIGDWTECTKPCNGGHRSREILCFEMNTRTPVDAELCNPHIRPLYMETCNLEPCLEWELTKWSPCSASCDEGIKTRTVHCPQSNMCNEDAKPEERIPCQVHPCIDWVAGPWSQCPVTCGGGHQLRHVKCVNHTSQEPATGCDLTTKPQYRQNCNMAECLQDKSAKFSTCLDKLDTKLCLSLQHMCTTWYFKVKCCRTCKKYTVVGES